MTKKIVITGGGTAGHIMPNLALLPLIKKNFDEIYYFGSKNSMEEEILKNYKEIKFIPIPTTKLVRKLTLKNFLIPFKLINGIHKTKKEIKKINPDVIFCKGGYVSVPVAIAGKCCKIPVVAHESDFSIGLANKIILKFANKMCTSFENTAKISKKCVCTGSPIRNQIFKGNKQNILTKQNFDKNKPFVLFFGGSLGSKNINNLVKNSLLELTKQFNVLHITGKNNKLNIKAKNYYQTEFTNSIEDFFACSDIVVCRGGANSLFELLALKKPMLIIPLSKAESRGDQLENADYFKKHYLAEILFEENASTKTLIKKLNNLNKNKTKIISAMSSEKVSANEKIVKIIIENMKNL